MTEEKRSIPLEEPPPAEIVRLIRNGFAPQTIADRYQITRERLREILREEKP